jgi:hypothetical protein
MNLNRKFHLTKSFQEIIGPICEGVDTQSAILT